jgi:hypothetical protein
MDPCRLTAPPRRNLEPRTRGAGPFREIAAVPFCVGQTRDCRSCRGGGWFHSGIRCTRGHIDPLCHGSVLIPGEAMLWAILGGVWLYSVLWGGYSQDDPSPPSFIGPEQHERRPYHPHSTSSSI